MARLHVCKHNRTWCSTGHCRAFVTHRHQRRATFTSVIARAGKDVYKGDSAYGIDDSKYLSMRAEVEAPYRNFRLLIFGFLFISACIGFLFATPALIGALAKAPNAQPLEEAAASFGIDLGALALVGGLLKRDWDARQAQMRRMGREERLASCSLQLASGKTLRLGRLRSFARPVIFCGTGEQVAQAREAAEKYKDDLLRRGVFLVPLPLQGDDAEQLPAPASGGQESDDNKWEGRPIRAEEWREWFRTQAADANKQLDNGLYVGLRLDGRVRTSGTGCPPWGKMALQLAPIEGMWSGMWDGMDGKVGG